MVRAPSIDKNGIQRGAWSEDEDNKLRDYIQRYGHWNWRQLPRFAGLSRCGKSCRLRWLNYLRPGLKRGNYTEQEGKLILKLREEIGNKWSAIAKKLPGRSDNDIKNYWHTHLKKGTKQDPKSCMANKQTCVLSQQTNAANQDELTSIISISESTQRRVLDTNIVCAEANTEVPCRSCTSTPCGCTLEWSTEDHGINQEESLDETFESFWNELDTQHNQILSRTSCNSTLPAGLEWATEDSLNSMESFAQPFECFWPEPFISYPSYSQVSSTTSCNTPPIDGMDCFKEDTTSSDKSFPHPSGSFWGEPSSLDTSYNNVIPQPSPVEEGFMLPFTPFDTADVES